MTWNRGRSLAVAAIAATAVAGAAAAAQQPPQPPKPAPQPMGFFITSAGPGNGANLGGLEGADKHCQTLAAAAGGGNRTWRAYLSTQPAGGQPGVNARDRIGTGPWYNVKGQLIAANVADLHGDHRARPQQHPQAHRAQRKGRRGQRRRRQGESARHAHRLRLARPGAARSGEHHHVRQLDVECRHQPCHAWPPRSAGRCQRLLERRPSERRLQPGVPGQDRRRGPVLLLRGDSKPRTESAGNLGVEEFFAAPGFSRMRSGSRR